MAENVFLRSWALVLAAGDGNRLRGLTADLSGAHVPKQFCALASERTLLEESLARAARVVPKARIATIVASQHRRWWEPVLRTGDLGPCVIQPENRGTGFGVLLPMLAILAKDPDALVVVFPSDHFVRDEWVLSRSIGSAICEFRGADRDASPILLGITPSGPDPDLGYIVPIARSTAAPVPVGRFVEKPGLLQAHRMLHGGALWNSFIFVTPGRTVVERFESAFSEEVAALRAALTENGGNEERLAEVYRELPTIDFSRFFFANAPRLRVLTVPPCGWSDLGTPDRLHSCRQASARKRVSIQGFTSRSVEPLERYSAPTVRATSAS